MSRTFCGWMGLVSAFIGLSTAGAANFPDFPHSDPALIGLPPLLSTWLGNSSHFARSSVDQHTFQKTLADGTQIKGLYFPFDESATDTPVPLIIANFGLTSDIYGSGYTQVLKSLILTKKLAVDFIVLDSVSSIDFYDINREISLGGYDEGHLLNLFTQEWRSEPGHSPTQSVYIFGVSLGGNGAVQALIEDQRLGTNLFKGAISFDGPLNEEESTADVLSSLGFHLKFDTAASTENPETKPKLGEPGHILASIVGKYTLSSLKWTTNPADPIPAKVDDLGAFFYNAFTRRLKRLGANTEKDPSWDPRVSHDSVEAYLASASPIVDDAAQLKVPLFVINGKDDPLIHFDEFKAFAKKELNNPYVWTHAETFGGHWGDVPTYGTEQLEEIIRRLLARSKDL